ncbi:MAG: hypothetical protein AMXMBFR13_15060 [Phycisphaerae bacterium]
MWARPGWTSSAEPEQTEPAGKRGPAVTRNRGARTMQTTLIALANLLLFTAAAWATEFHVSPKGNDSNDGTKAAPLRTIQRAADRAQPGDVITVHSGIYRERINPPRGGSSDDQRITYQAAPGEQVEIKGSEAIRGWEKVQNDTWKVILPNAFFGSFNPYSDLIRGDWFNPKDREHHTGAVYLNGEWLTEAAKQEEVLQPVAATPLWFARVDEANTTIWAQFKAANPNEQLVEINVRRTVFYPDRPGRNFITVRGFTMRQAATPWAPPTAEQIGLIGTHWSKGWIIENNRVSHSICSGIALGKHGDEFDNTSANTAEGYVKTIERGLAKGWSKENIGHHVVRNNVVSHCEQAGVVGSLGPVFSKVIGNVIHDIHVRQLFTGAEMAGIKFHAAIDVEISRNHIYRTCRGLWLDWMAQGTRVTGNLFHDNQTEDLFVEVNHGPFLVDNNIFLSPTALLDMSQGGAYAHNLFTGRLISRSELSRSTPYHPPHTTEVAGLKNIKGGDNRFYNNVLLHPEGLAVYDARVPSHMDGNVFLKGAKPSKFEAKSPARSERDPKPRLMENVDGWLLELTLDETWTAKRNRPLVTTELLGRASVPDLPYVQPDGSSIQVNTDYCGRPRRVSDPVPGPFADVDPGTLKVKVWPNPAGAERALSTHR